MSDYDWTNSKFKLLYGQRIVDESHNWVIFRNTINLGFSYMTFVIKEAFEEQQDSAIDIEGFDYIFYKNTLFTQNRGEIFLQDFQKI